MGQVEEREEYEPSDIGTSYVGNSNTHKFHKNSCSSVNQTKPNHRVELSTREDAINAGYDPCKRCYP